MPQIITTGLVIRRSDYSDYDRMVTLFSPDRGRIDAIARGCRRPKSPLVNAVEPFTSGEFQLFEHRGRYTLEQCQISESYFDLRADYDRLRHGVYWLKLLDEAILPDTAAETLFIVTLRALAHLNWGELPPELVTFAFEMHYLALNGFSPGMSACVRCGRPVDGDARFDADLGGVVCADCPSSAPRITNGARRILLKAPRTQFDRFQLLADRPQWPEAAAHLRRYIDLKLHQQRFAPPLYGSTRSESR
ncbi:MAG: DNA repair protein RecO [Clostridia bacterium]|nr:DNA repair protein RecO [Clostridia bacterium]